MPGKDKQLYRELCEKEADIPLFSQPWWLDAVCEKGDWGVSLAFDREGEILGAMPYFLRSYKGFKLILMPLLTPSLKIWFNYPEEAGHTAQISFENRITEQLISNLPPVAYFTRCFDYGFKNWLPFYWKGFKQSTKYSYVLEDLSDVDKVFGRFKPDVRNKVRKAEGLLEIRKAENVDLFYEINSKSFERQGRKPPYSKAFLHSLDEALEARKQRSIYFAYDMEGNIHAANYLVWDEDTVYNLALGADTKFRSSGAVQFLLWHAIQLASGEGKRFDFEGSMMPGIEPVFRAFGGIQKPYFHIYKGKNRLFEALKIFLRG